MKFILGFIFILNIWGLTVLAQSPPPPPPPLIYKAPEKSSLKEFIAADKSFQATFPDAPQIKEQKLDNGSFTMYRVYRAGSNSIINVSESTSDIEGKKEKVYELARSNFLKAPKSKIESEKDISVDGKSGKEFSVLQDYNYRRVRIIVTGKRVYEIINDVTNWHILNDYYKEKIDDFNKETDRFFSSFKILDKK